MKATQKVPRRLLACLIMFVLAGVLFAYPKMMAYATTPVPTRVANAQLELVPSVTTLKAGDTFDLSLKIIVDSPTRAVQAGLKFDPSLVEITGGEEGDFLKTWAQANNGQTIMLPSQISADNTQGKMLATGISIVGGSKGGATGSGVIYTLHLKAKGNGVANFSLTDIEVYDDGSTTNNIPVEYQGVKAHDLALNIGGGAAVVSQPTSYSALVATSPADVLPTQAATAVVRSNTTDASSSGSSFPWLIVVPVAGVLAVGGVIVATTHKKK